MKKNQTRQSLFETVYIPTLDDLAELEDELRDLPIIGMHKRMDDEETPE